MKFDLNKALLGEKVVTRNGIEVLIWLYDVRP